MADMEKLTINLTPVDLGQIELLVQQGFYANRAEFIRVAIHSQLARHGDTIKETAARHALVIGAVFYDRRSLERARTERKRLNLQVVGLLTIADDVDAKLALATIESIKVHGIFRAPAAVKAALKEREQ